LPGLTRPGKDINYESVTRPVIHSEGGVNAMVPVVRTSGDDG